MRTHQLWGFLNFLLLSVCLMQNVCVCVWVEGGRVWSGHAVMQCSVVGRFLCAGVERRGRYGSESVGYGGSGSNLVQMVYLSTNLNLECTHVRRHTLKQRNLINTTIMYPTAGWKGIQPGQILQTSETALLWKQQRLPMECHAIKRLKSLTNQSAMMGNMVRTF